MGSCAPAINKINGEPFPRYAWGGCRGDPPGASMGGGFEPSLHFLTQFFQIFTLVRRVFLQIFVLFFGPRSSIFLPKKGGGVPQVHWVIIRVRWGKKNHHSLWFPFRCKGDQKTSRGQDCGLRSCQAGGVEQSLVNCWKFMASWEMFQWPEMEVFRWGKSSRMKVGPNHGNFGFSKKGMMIIPGWLLSAI